MAIEDDIQEWLKSNTIKKLNPCAANGFGSITQVKLRSNAAQFDVGNKIGSGRKKQDQKEYQKAYRQKKKEK